MRAQSCALQGSPLQLGHLPGRLEATPILRRQRREAGDCPGRRTGVLDGKRAEARAPPARSRGLQYPQQQPRRCCASSGPPPQPLLSHGRGALAGRRSGLPAPGWQAVPEWNPLRSVLVLHSHPAGHPSLNLWESRGSAHQTFDGPGLCAWGHLRLRPRGTPGVQRSPLGIPGLKRHRSNPACPSQRRWTGPDRSSRP